eukprot:TRINITY_DN2807_c0_g1_i1.p1 TRINITY_DN2807_c0_g1~~TRINITY_DN2807_c0_g1_i1.p1  ORF type:complete len:723 (+),score=176.57 TRINITY_DN2807_c0_g1_i1:77-2170(+)
MTSRDFHTDDDIHIYSPDVARSPLDKQEIKEAYNDESLDILLSDKTSGINTDKPYVPPPGGFLAEWIEEDKESLKAYAQEIKDNVATKEGWQKSLRRVKADWKSGFTVALVNLPLSISLAVAADSTPTAGVLTLIWAGIFAALFGGCVYNIVGPTGALSGILARAVAEYNQDALPYLTILVGITCFIVFAFRLERYVLLVPGSVDQGFTLGVAFIIGFNQLNFALGLKRYPRHEEFTKNVKENLDHVPADYHTLSIITTLVTFCCQYALSRRWNKIPWVIVICILGILAGFLTEEFVSESNRNFRFQTLGTRFPQMAFSLFEFPTFSSGYLTVAFFSTSFSISFVAILETLISAKVADSMTKTHFKQRREVFGLGLANIVTGIFGGIPATAALARTSLNIRSGATSRMSAILNVVFAAILSAVLLRFFKYLPLPVVAGIIIVVAVRMVDYTHFVRFWQLDKTVFFVAILTAVICVIKDPTAGIVVGMVLALLIFADNVSNVHSEVIAMDDEGKKVYFGDRRVYEDGKIKEVKEQRRQHLASLQPPGGDINLEVEGETDGDIQGGEKHPAEKAMVYRMSGQLTYINGFAHRSRLSFIEEQNIIISLRYLYYLDPDGVEVLGEIFEDLERGGKEVYFTGVNPTIERMLLRAHWFEDLAEKRGAQRRIFKTYVDCLRFLSKKLLQSHHTDLEAVNTMRSF